MFNPKVSVFKDLYKSTDVPYIVHIEKVVNRIKLGKSKVLIDKIREGRKDLKPKLPSIVFAGEFTERNAKALKQHSGLMVFDFDKYPDTNTMLGHLEVLKWLHITFNITEQDAKANYYLTIKISNESFSNQSIDKIVVKRGYKIVKSEDISNQLKYNPLKIKVQPFFIDDDKSTLKVILTFTKENKEYYQIFENILVKEPIYLP